MKNCRRCFVCIVKDVIRSYLRTGFFCPYCGSNLKNSAAEEPEVLFDGYDVVHKKSILEDPRAKRALIISGVALLAATATVCAYFVIRNQDNGKSESFCKDMLGKKDQIVSSVKDKVRARDIKEAAKKFSQLF